MKGDEMTTNEKLAWSTGVIAGTGLVVYSILLLTGMLWAASVVWLAAAVCVAILAAYVVVMLDHTPDTDQQDAWVLGRAYRGQQVSKQMLLPVGGMALSIIFLQVGFLALASAMFSGVLAAMLLLSITELMYFNRQHEAPRISPAKSRGTAKL